MCRRRKLAYDIIIDRIEGKYAVCEFPCEEMRDVEVEKIPFPVSEGDHLHIEYDEIGTVKVITKIPKPPKRKRFGIKSRFMRFT